MGKERSMSPESSNELINRLKEDIKRWEGQEIEFMEDFPSNTHELAKEIAAFASSNPGVIYLGVTDNKEIVGVSSIRERGETEGKDWILNRLAGITHGTVKPSIKVTVDFINYEDKVIVKINVPKGFEPIYCVNNVPYIRNLTTSDRPTPDKLKEAHREYFLRQGMFEEVDETNKFLTDVLFQLSDFQILWSDYKNRTVNPDLNQMLYDIGTTSKALLDLSTDLKAKELNLADDLEKLGELLREIELHEFYIGKECVIDFSNKGNKALKLTNNLLQRVLKRYELQREQLNDIKRIILKNINELHYCWRKRDQYLWNGELSTLKDTLRRLAYIFNRYGTLPSQFEDFNVAQELRNLARNLREVSSQKYFIEYNPIKKIEDKMNKILKISDTIKDKIS